MFLNKVPVDLGGILQAHWSLFWENVSDSLLVVNENDEVVFYNKPAQVLFNDLGYKKLDIKALGIASSLSEGKPKYNLRVKVENAIMIINILPMGDRYCLIIIQDITKLENLEHKLEAIEETNKELNDIIDLSADGLVSVNGNGIILRMNKAYEDIVGIKGENFVGRPVRCLKEEGYLPDLVSSHVITDLKPKNLFLRIRDKDVLLTGRPVFNNSGKLIRIVANIRDLSELNKLKEEIKNYKQLTERYQTELNCFRAKYSEKQVVASSYLMRKTLEFVMQAAQVDANVLICGESGTGKEVIAKIIHQSGNKRKGPFISINCGAIPANLLESELFGYEPGAFTGASKTGRVGLFEAAAEGILFLDEIGEMPLELQVKLLRVIQERTFRRVGSNKEKELKSRLVAATNRDLKKMVDKGSFRKDLYYRLNVIQIHVPPLRERKEDIPPLVNQFLNKFNTKYKLNKKIPDHIMVQLLAYDWPGNVRELENAIERLVVFSQGALLEPELMREAILGNPIMDNYVPITGSLQTVLEETERRLILSVYKECGSTRKTALKLGVSQPTIVRKLQKYMK